MERFLSNFWSIVMYPDMQDTEHHGLWWDKLMILFLYRAH
jgi:hypothetical protein